MYRKIWTAKNNFYDLKEHIKNVGAGDLIKHFKQWIKMLLTSQSLQVMNLLEFAVTISKTFLNNIVFAGKFAIFMDESTNEAGRAKLVIFVCFGDSIIQGRICLYSKLQYAKTFEAIMTELEATFLEKNIDKTKISFLGLDETNAMNGEKKG